MAGYVDHEAELESLGELEAEDELEDEFNLGSLIQGIGGLLGSGEGEDELEAEDEFEDEFNLGSLIQGIGGLLGSGEGEDELEDEFNLGSLIQGIGGLLGEGEDEGEQFFGNAFRGISRFVRRNAPMLKKIAKVAAPLVGTAVGGPLGGMIGKVATSALEGEYEAEDEFEFEAEDEFELEAEGPISTQEALAELMATAAAEAESEEEAEAMAGAAVVTVINAADRAALLKILPHMVRGTAILTRILRARPITRPAVRVVPTIVKGTAKTLVRQAATGRPVTRKVAAKVMANQTKKVLGRPATCAAAMKRNVRAAGAITRATGTKVAPHRSHPGRPSSMTRAAHAAQKVAAAGTRTRTRTRAGAHPRRQRVVAG